MEIIESILTNNPCYRAGKKIKVRGLMLHSVGCPQPSAEVFIHKWNDRSASRACIHAFIDGNTGKIYQTLPWDHRAWHCGGSANNSHIGVEMCEPACIRYTKGAVFTCSDQQKAGETVKRTYEAAVRLFAYLCRKYGLDPLADGVIISHKEGHDRGIASGHADPDHLWKQLTCGYSMNGFRLDVKTAMEGNPAAECSSQAGSAIREGMVVTLSPDAVYYTGKAMPDWVKKDRWIVKSVSADRAVIDRNESGTRAISSPVHIRYLRMAGAGEEEQQPAEHRTVPCQPAPAQPPVQMNAQAGQQSISERGVELIARFEGCRLKAYKCPAGVWTIGYGHTEGVKEGSTLDSEQEARQLLRDDLKKYGEYVNSCVRKGQIFFPLTQNQFDALTSFVYNCGNGNLSRLVSGRNAAVIAQHMLEYNKGGGRVLEGLVKRRKEEHDLFTAE